MKPFLYYRSGVAYARLCLTQELRQATGKKYLVRALGSLDKHRARLYAELFALEIKQQANYMSGFEDLPKVLINQAGVTIDSEKPEDIQFLKDNGMYDDFMEATKLGLQAKRKKIEFKTKKLEGVDKPKYTLGQAVEAYISDRKKYVTPRQSQDIEFTLNIFLSSLVDFKADSSGIDTKKLKDDVLEKLDILPFNLMRKPEFKKYFDGELRLGLEVFWMYVKAGKHENYQIIKARTKDKHIDTLKSFWGWAENEGFYNLPKNPFLNIRKFANKTAIANGEVLVRYPFTDEELSRIFSKELVLKVKSEGQYWVSLIGLFTGARLNEIAQLHTADIFYVDGIACMRILDDIDRKSVKNDSSRRGFPLPQKLLDFGFIEYYESMKSLNQVYLFPTFYNATYSFGRQVGKWFNDTCLKSKSINIQDKTFHNLRHTFINKLRESGADDKTIMDFSGHSDDEKKLKSVLYKVYLKTDKVYPLKHAVDKIVYGNTFFDVSKEAPGLLKRWRVADKEWIKKNEKNLPLAL